MVATARRRNRDARVRVERVQGEELGLEKRAFDRVYSVHCLYFWKQPEQVFAAARASIASWGTFGPRVSSRGQRAGTLPRPHLQVLRAFANPRDARAERAGSGCPAPTGRCDLPGFRQGALSRARRALNARPIGSSLGKHTKQPAPITFRYRRCDASRHDEHRNDRVVRVPTRRE